MTRRAIRGAVPSVVLTLVVACAGPDGRPDGPLAGEILVSAAASLADAFAGIEEAFERTNPGVDVVLNPAGSSALREQILEGAPVDVFASANLANMERVAEAGLVAGTPEVFARNRLVVAVPAGNPGRVQGLDDLSRDELLVGLCAEGVPCGDLARRILREAGVAPSADTNEPDARALLAKVVSGELDAGIVYATDAGSAGDAVATVPIPPHLDVAADYAIARLSGSANPETAAAFVRFVLSAEGRSILGATGFEVP